MKIEKLNKLFIGVIMITVLAYAVHFIDVSFFANDITQITSKAELITKFIPAKDVQQFNSIIDMINNTTSAIRAFFATVAAVSGIGSVIGLVLINVFAKRVEKYKSFFNYSGLIIISAVTVSMQIKLMPNFDGLVSLLLGVATILMIAFSICYIIVGVVGLYKVVMSDEFKVAEIYTELAKVLSFVFTFYVAVIIIGKINIYMSIAVLVREIDLAAFIDVMNYVQIDWNAVLPQAIMSSGLVSQNSIDMFINKMADQYVLNYASDIVQNFILSVSSSFIFNNILVYIASLFTGICILFTTNHKFDYKKYVALALYTVALVLCYIYLGGLIMSILGMGYIVCIVFVIIDIFKELKK